MRREMQKARAKEGVPLLQPGRQLSIGAMVALTACTSKVMYVCINVQSAELISLNNCIN